jgi:hypothetical protein
MTPQERKNFESTRDNVHSEQAQKQEPVGRFSKFTDGVWREVTATSAGQFLYASPPQRQPLMLEQLREHWQVAKVLDMTDAEIDFADYVLIARDVEGLHGIKGEA